MLVGVFCGHVYHFENSDDRRSNRTRQSLLGIATRSPQPDHDSRDNWCGGRVCVLVCATRENKTRADNRSSLRFARSSNGREASCAAPVLAARRRKAFPKDETIGASKDLVVVASAPLRDFWRVRVRARPAALVFGTVTRKGALFPALRVLMACLEFLPFQQRPYIPAVLQCVRHVEAQKSSRRSRARRLRLRYDRYLVLVLGRGNSRPWEI